MFKENIPKTSALLYGLPTMQVVVLSRGVKKSLHKVYIFRALVISQGMRSCIQ